MWHEQLIFPSWEKTCSLFLSFFLYVWISFGRILLAFWHQHKTSFMYMFVHSSCELISEKIEIAIKEQEEWTCQTDYGKPENGKWIFVYFFSQLFFVPSFAKVGINRQFVKYRFKQQLALYQMQTDFDCLDAKMKK